MTTSPQCIADVEVFIEGEGPEAIVMVHGWPDSHRLWDDTVARLKSQHRCIRFTLPGFDVARPSRAHSLDEVVATLKAVIELSCPGEQVTLLLHDWGCLFGYQFAMQHPQLVKRIVGVDIGDAGSAAHVRSLGAKAKAMVFGYQSFLALAWFIGGGLGDRMARWMARLLRAPAPADQINAAMGYPYFIRWTGAYGGYGSAVPIKAQWPMLFIYGQRKPFQFHSAAFVAALNATPGSAAVGMKTGHWVMKNKPVEFNEAVAAWLAPGLQVGQGPQH